jgi:MFS family permease
LPPELVASAIRTGVRYVANAPEFRVVLIRYGAYVLAFSALPALLAVLTRTRLHGSATDYGLLLGALGIGGVAGAVVLPRVRSRWPVDRIVVTGTISYGAVLAALGALDSIGLAFALLLLAGLVGMANMSSLNIASQSVLPDWVRGRGLALVQLVFMLAFAAGGVLWGTLATGQGIPTALELAGACLAATALLAFHYPLGVAADVDVSLAEQAEPYVPVTLSPDDGPVLLSVEYRVPEASHPAFFSAARMLGQMRRRDGAMHWGLYSDPNDPERQVETFVSPSWSEHLRTATRQTRSDAEIGAAVRAFHADDQEPRLTALLAHKELRGRAGPRLLVTAPDPQAPAS